MILVEFDNKDFENSLESYQPAKYIWTILESIIDTFTSRNMCDHFNVVMFASRNTNLLKLMTFPSLIT